MENFLYESGDKLLFIISCVVLYQILKRILRPLIKSNKSIKKYLNAHPEIIRKKGRPAILETFTKNLARFLIILLAFAGYALFYIK